MDEDLSDDLAGGGPGARQEMLDFLDDAPMVRRRLRRGDLVEGVVVHVGRDGILVDVGAKAEALIPPQEAGLSESGGPPAVQVGDQVVARVVDAEGNDGLPILSLARAQAEQSWRLLQRIFSEGATVEAEVVEANRGGLVVGVHGLRGFVPLSQLVGSSQPGQSEEALQARLEQRKGEALTLKVLELNRQRNRVILSERAVEHERRARERDRLVEELREGEIRRGRVSSIADFGAFVDLGGADGLVHISELAWTPAAHPSEVVQVGDELEVLVLGVDREKRKISLSLKRARGEPWDTVAERYKVGETIQARVRRLAAFGAFVEVEPGVEGLIHISELADYRIQHPRQVVHEGEVLTVKILRIEPDRRRLGLSLRQAQEELESGDWQGVPVTYGGPAHTVAEVLEAQGAALVGAEPEETDWGEQVLQDDTPPEPDEDPAPAVPAVGSG